MNLSWKFETGVSVKMRGIDRATDKELQMVTAFIVNNNINNNDNNIKSEFSNYNNYNNDRNGTTIKTSIA